MASKVKSNGVLGGRLNEMADRGGRQTTDRRDFPPSKVMLPALRRGYVRKTRVGGLGNANTTVWLLTEAGWDAIGRQPPAPSPC